VKTAKVIAVKFVLTRKIEKKEPFYMCDEERSWKK